MQYIGFAVWQLQELESLAASYLVIRVKGSNGMGREKGEALLATTERRAFGNLLRELESAGVIPTSMRARLQAALDHRNWLVHRSRRDSRGVLDNAEAYSALVGRLDRISEEALQILRELGAELEAFVVSQGVSQEQIDADAERIAKSWGLNS